MTKFNLIWMFAIAYLKASNGAYEELMVKDEPCFLYNINKDILTRILVLVCDRNMNYTDFPKDELRAALEPFGNRSKQLSLNSKRINKIPSYSFIGFELIKLDLSSNRIEEIEVYAFYGLDKLESLNLGNNLIRIIQQGSFHGLGSLYSLGLNSQRLEIIRNNTFVGLTNLEVLDLRMNLIVTVDAFAFAGLDHVYNLYMGSNKIQHVVSNTFQGLISMFSLNLTYYGILNLDERAFVGLINLTMLDLSNNLLTSIKRFTFTGLDYVSHLNISENKLKEIESGSFSGLFSMESLQLTGNRLTKIPGHMLADNKLLRYLDLTNNLLIDIEVNALAGSSMSLTNLNLYDNRFDFIKRHYFAGLVQLKALNLSYNLISAIESGSFSDSVNLVLLDLSRNCIFEIHEDLLSKLVNLNTIDLSKNTIKRISESAFKNQYNLRVFKFSNHYFTQAIAAGSLSELDLSFGYLLTELTISESLESLRLSNCEQAIIVSSTNQSLFNLKYLYLSNFKMISVTNMSIFTNLEDLDLSSNDLRNVSYFFTSKTSYGSLKKLNLRNSTLGFELNVLTRFPNLIDLDLGWSRFNLNFQPSGNLKNLEVVRLNNLGLDSSFLSKYFNFFNMNHKTKIRVLDLSYNLFDSFPPLKVSKCCHSLEYLDLRNNSLKNFDFDLFINNINFELNYLDLSFNNLSVMTVNSYNAGRMNKVNTLLLKGNPISWEEMEENIRRAIFSVKYKLSLSNTQISREIFYNLDINDFELRYLDLSGNRMITYPVEFLRGKKSLFKVINIDLSQNQMTYLNESTFDKYTMVQFLNLSFNHLSTIEADLFSSLNSLKSIDLGHNQLECLDQRSFRNQLFLEYLNLECNLIKHLTLGLFANLDNLMTLDLSGNLISELDLFIFPNLTSLMDLMLDSNPLPFIEGLPGLTAIKNVYFSSRIFHQARNIISLKGSIEPHLVKISSLTRYYKTVYLISVDQLHIDSAICTFTLYLARYFILLNLKQDSDLSLFLSGCQEFAKTLFNG